MGKYLEGDYLCIRGHGYGLPVCCQFRSPSGLIEVLGAFRQSLRHSRLLNTRFNIQYDYLPIRIADRRMKRLAVRCL